jgi:predicted lipoprotein with Yx(FWY)xxD motif
MIHRRLLTLLGLAIVALSALGVAGCGGGGDGSNASPTQSSDGTPTLRVANTELGDVLIDPANRTVYLFKKDNRDQSTCSGACAHDWPPVRATGKPTAGSGAKAALVGTAKRSDGTPQLTYNGHPLYLFTGDNAPGATNGQGITAFGAQWFVVSPAGNQVSGKSTAGRSNGY